VVGDPTEHILLEAGRLFGRLGINGTTMARLANEVGLKQSSLYYYFRSRDEVVAALVAKANVVPLQLAVQLARADASAPARLLAFVRGDVVALCNLPLDIGEIHRIATRDREQFADYWKGRRRLERLLGGILSEGVSAGDFRPVEPKLTALLIMGNDEGVQNWYREGTRKRPADIGDALARVTVGGLLAGKRTIDDVAAEAANLPTS
jgi:AcrR family transcriptional regulator